MTPPRKLHIGAQLRHWHRRLGVAASVFVVWLAISGILLNEGSALGLDHVKISGQFITAIYGLSDNAPVSGFSAGNHWLVSSELGAILDGHLIDPPLAGAIGFVTDGKLLYVGLSDGLALLTSDGQLVEVLRTPTLPISKLNQLGLSKDHRLVISGTQTYASIDGENWSEIASEQVTWSLPTNLPDAQRQLISAALQPKLPLSRVLADAHSGRLFGRFGHWIIDLVGLAALGLAMTGVWVYLRAVRRQT